MESIWHTADEKPIIEKYRIIELNDGRLSLNNTDSRPLSMIKRWCYLDDLLEFTETEANPDLTRWTHKDLQALVKIKDKNIDHYLDRIKELEQELSKVKQALDLAVDALIYANKCIKGGCVNWITHIDKVLEQITALEQKDNK